MYKNVNNVMTNGPLAHDDKSKIATETAYSLPIITQGK